MKYDNDTKNVTENLNRKPRGFCCIHKRSCTTNGRDKLCANVVFFFEVLGNNCHKHLVDGYHTKVGSRLQMDRTGPDQTFVVLDFRFFSLLMRSQYYKCGPFYFCSFKII